MHQGKWFESRWLVWLLAALMLAAIVIDVLPADSTVLEIPVVIVLLITGAFAIWLVVVLRRRERQTRIQEERYRLLAENASDIVTRVSLSGTLEWISPSVRTVLGWDPDQLVGSHPWDLVHPDDRAAARASLADAAMPGHEAGRLVTRFQKVDGSYVWLSAFGTKSAAGNFVVSFRDVDDEVRAREATVESEARFRLLAENAMDLVFSLDMHAVIQWVSPSVVAMLGYRPEELVGQSGAVLVEADDLPVLLAAAEEARVGVASSCEIRMRSKSGDDRWVDATPRPIFDATGTLVGGVIGVRDIDAEMTARNALAHASDFDPLTGLARRGLARTRIGEILDDRGDQDWALICVGVNGLTAVNQAYTYTAGDAVLLAVAERLVQAAGAVDSVARIAGDEFAVMVPDIHDATDAAAAAERILAAVRGPVTVGQASVDVTACAGIAMANHGDAEDLLRDSTAAMRQATARGHDRWEFLDGNVGEQTRGALVLQTSLRDAIGAGSLRPWLMPIVRLVDSTVLGYEVLVRWVHADGTVAGPADFLDVAERSGLIVDIDNEMLRRAIDLLRASSAIDRLAVNVSAATLASGTLTAKVAEALNASDIDPRRLHLEVTETSLFEVTSGVRSTMGEIAGLGVAWWVDDFGIGYSSISHLRDLPITGLKLDQSFTAGLTLVDSQATKLSQGLVGLAEGLGLQTIAEGIETVEQSAVLIQQGWQQGQGWLYGKPAAAPVSRG